nr:PAS domain-containing protein [Wenzhouxiangella limi]
MIGLLGTDGRLQYVNDAALDYVGLPAGRIIGRFAWETPWFAGQAERVERLVDAIGRASKGEFVEFPEALSGAGGTTRYFTASLTPLQPAPGWTQSLLARAWEINASDDDSASATTAVNAINGQFGEFYQKYLRGLMHGSGDASLHRRVFDLNQTALVMLDRSGLIRSFNDKAAVLFDGADGFAIGHSLASILPPLRQLIGAESESDQIAGRWAGRLSAAADVVLNHNQTGPTRVCFAIRQLPADKGYVVLLGEIPDLDATEIMLVDSREVAALKNALHDGPANELVALRLRIEQMARIRSASDEQLNWLRSWLRDLTAVESSLRALIDGLPPASVTAGTFYSSVSRLAGRVSMTFAARCRYRLFRPLDLPDDNVAHHLFLIVQEAVTNAVRHSTASEIEVLIGAGGRDCVVIRDNGGGFGLEALFSGRGHGVRSMRLRAKEIGADIGFGFEGSRGTEIVVSL